MAQEVFRSKTQLLLRECWRKAWARAKEGRALEIQFKSESQAHKARMDLYKAVQPEKQGKGEDLFLIAAAQGIEIVLKPGQKNVLVMRDRGQGDIMQALQEAAGVELQEIVDPELAYNQAESLRKIQEQLERDKEVPFYGKRGE